MLEHVDQTLRNLLEHPEHGLPRFKFNPAPVVSFATPDGKFAPSAATINVFLYDVRENRELRLQEPIVERTADGRAQISRPPTRIDCSYLITAWASEGDPAVEHRLLGAVLQVLVSVPVIPVDVLDDALRGDATPLPSVALQTGRLQSVGEFWQTTGGRPKAVLHFTVTISVVDTRAPKTEHIVTERIVRMRVNGGGES